MPIAHPDPQPRRVLLTGGTGYLGRALIPLLLARGHRVRALVRNPAAARLDPSVELMAGNPLEAASVERALQGMDAVVHLVGVPKPSPAKARLFREVDLVSIRATVEAAARAQPRPHVVYVSAAHPAPVMKAYIEVRQEGETLLRDKALDATCLRPWYVLGPGHRWPYLLLPVYAVLGWIPATRPGAQRLGFVTLAQMARALADAVDAPAHGFRIVEVPEIRRA